MTASGQSPSAGPSVCPFVALAEDRDRRADSPDEGNRCYAERAPRQRDLAYQAEFCYSQQFSSCSVFLGWAARNAAEPADAGQAAQRAWSERSATSPHAEPDGVAGGDMAAKVPTDPSPETGLFGPAGPGETPPVSRSEQVDWVSASAWAEVPWDERAELEADDLELDIEDEIDEQDEDDLRATSGPDVEATQAPKVPAAVPIRKRKRAQPVIRSRGSGEWYYADPPGREPLVKRRYGVTPPILLGVLGLLVAALVVFLIPTLFLSGNDSGTAAAPSPSIDAVGRPAATRAPQSTAAASAEPSPSREPNPRSYRVRAGDSLTGIATRFEVKVQHLQCINRILNRNVIRLDQRLQIPPEGFSCPQGWRNATPEPG